MASNQTEERRPNFLVILADDLGYSDIGCFGSEIKTPNIDRLANEGVRFSDFHTASVCSPTRSMLMSGTDCHLAGMGVMYEARNQDPERFNRAGHEGFMNHDVAALSEILQDAGYHTMISGKWHLGYKAGHIPHDRGFDSSWGLLPGCSNHFGWEPVWDGGENGRPRLGGLLPMLYVDQDKRWMPGPNKTSNPDTGYYSSTYSVTNLLSYLKRRKSSPDLATKPFFAYLPFTAPHYPLQCPPTDRDKYKGMYDDGPDALRSRRLEGLKKAGVVDQDVKPHKVITRYPEWETFTTEEKKMSSRAMEVYAGMVDRIDQEVGRVMKYLEDSGEYDNTVIMFMSDNGAEGAALEAGEVMGPRMLAAIDKWFDNSYENLGNYNSFIWYGPRWAQAATAPHKLMKSFSTEGGIRVPFVMRYPGFNLQPGSVSSTFATVMDIMPTFLTLAGAEHPNPSPETPRSKAPYRGHQVYPMRGKDWTPYLTEGKMANGATDPQHAIYGDTAVGWEMHERCALRKGKWKIVDIPLGPHGKGGWELYDMTSDRGETENLADREPEILIDLVKEWTAYVEETGTVFGVPMRHGPALPFPADMLGGDVVEDMRAWMRVGQGRNLGEKEDGNADADNWQGIKAEADGGLDKLASNYKHLIRPA